MLIEAIKKLILEFQSQDLELGIPRRLNFVFTPNKPFVCLGARNTGKAMLLYQIIENLVAKGVSRENILYLNFCDDRLHELKHGDPHLILEAYYSLFPQKKNRETVYCFFFQVQAIGDWDIFIDHVLRTEQAEVFITGSSSKLRQRSPSWEIFPFSFREYLDFKGLEPEPLTTRKRLMIQQHFQGFWNSGGFPEVLEAPEPRRITLLQEYFKTILHRDVIERHDLRHPRAVVEMAYQLFSQAASRYSINNLTRNLKNLGYKLSKLFVNRCLECFEEAYLLFSVNIFDTSRSRQKVNLKKIYAIDHALIRAVGTGMLVNTGHLLENLVFLQLRRLKSGVCYYRTRSGKEVDFIWLDGDGRPQLIQVAETLVEPKIRKRKVQALAEAMEELRCHNATLVTQQETESIELAAGRIEVVPVWRLLLVLSALGE